MTKFEACQRLLEQAMRDHQIALNEAVIRFNALSPRAQQDEQLRKWAYLLTARKTDASDSVTP